MTFCFGVRRAARERSTCTWSASCAPSTVLERAAAFVNDVGLLAEEVDPESGELLGNFLQALSHIGLVNAAWAISEAELGQKPPVGDDLDTSHPSGRTPA
jgi:GH15 family glucan-1,4-alpha-glucosidase